MLQQQAALAKLFTFGSDQLKECLPCEKRKKFPFLHHGKLKKAVICQRIISSQRPASEHEVSEPPSHHRRRIMSNKVKESIFNLHIQNENKDENRPAISSSKQKHKQKQPSLPKVFKNVFSSSKANSSSRKRVISSENHIRYGDHDEMEVNIKPFIWQEGERHRKIAHKSNQLKSLAYLSDDLGSIAQQKLRTLQHRGRSKLSQRVKAASEYERDSGSLSRKVVEGINELKRIYNKKERDSRILS